MNWSKKLIVVIILFQPFICLKGYSQEDHSYSNYRNCVKSFYSLLFRKGVTIGELKKVYANGGVNQEIEQIICDSLKKSFFNEQLILQKKAYIDKNSSSMIIKEMRLYIKDLTEGLSRQQIYYLIDHAKIYNQGIYNLDFLELSFPNKKTIYFELNTDDPIQINWIYLDNGYLLEGKFYNNKPDKLVFVGTVNDPDGYVNVRERPSLNSKTVSKFTSGNYFYYYPDNGAEWLLVKSKEDGPSIGYVHKSRIQNYTEFSDDLKKRVIEDRN